MRLHELSRLLESDSQSVFYLHKKKRKKKKERKKENKIKITKRGNDTRKEKHKRRITTNG